jgi:hypothetical protein
LRDKHEIENDLFKLLEFDLDVEETQLSKS